MIQRISTPGSPIRLWVDRAAPGRSDELEVRLFRNANDVPAREWDSLLEPDDLQMSHRFVRICQESNVENAEYWHLMIYQQQRLCCVTTLSRIHVFLDLLSGDLPMSFCHTVRRCWPGFLRFPILFNGLPVSFGQPCLKLAPWADCCAVMRVIARTMERVARTTSTGMLCLKEFDPVASMRIDPICEEGFLQAFSLPSCSLPIVWDSFSGYVESMTAGYRRQVRATLQARKDAGLEFRYLDRFSTEGDVIYSLHQQVIQRARYRLETLTRSFIDRLDSNLGEQSRAIFLERQGRPLAVAIMLFTPNVATFLLAGLDYATPREWQVYPNLVAEVVAEAIRWGVSRLEMGQTSYPLKSRLGAREVPRFLYLRYRRPLGACLLHWLAPILFPQQVYPQRRVFRDDSPGGVP